MSRGRARRVSAHRLEPVTKPVRVHDEWGGYVTRKVVAHKRCGCLERVCAATGLAVTRFLGRGCYAAAWLTRCGRVLKITDETEAVALAQRLMVLQPQGKALRFVRTFAVHDAGVCELSEKRVWVLVQERLAPYGAWITGRGFVSNGPRRAWPSGPDDTPDDEPGQIPNPDEFRAIAESMREAGIAHMTDLHEANVMLRGDDLVVSDLGLYDVERVNPDNYRSPKVWNPAPTTPPFPRLRAFLAASCKSECKGTGGGPVPPT